LRSDPKNIFRTIEVLSGVRVFAGEPHRRIFDSKENNMIDKPTVLLVVIAIFIAAVWTMASSKAGRQVRSDWLEERLDMHQRYAYAQVMDDLGRTHLRDAQTNQDAIRRLYQECGSY
jgi:hypothetical protein